MKKCVNLFGVLLFSLVALTACQKQKPAAAEIVQATNGQQFNLAQYHGKWILINYWASWCKPCYQEIPALNAFYQEHKNKVLLLGVNYDFVPVNELTQLIQKMQIQFPVLVDDPSKELGINEIPGLPATYVINPEGQMEKPLLGKQTIASLQKRLGF